MVIDGAAPAGDESGDPGDDPTTSSGGDEADSDGDSPGAAADLAEGAVPAWQAVVDRDRYLARRGQRGVVEGVVAGPALRPAPARDAGAPAARDAGAPADAGTAAPLIWLVDDTEGAGCLAIRLALLDAPPPPGTRIAAVGAWVWGGAARGWYWQAETVAPLPAAPPAPDDLAAPPGHDLAAAPPPDDAHPVSAAVAHGVVTFQVVAAPFGDGEGWKIADARGDPPVASLLLPGERRSYGGHDLRRPDERWHLRAGVTYWVRIGKIHRHGPDRPVIIHGTSAPRRVP